MRYLLLLLLCFVFIVAHAQKIMGVVSDKSTKQPVSGALIRLGNAKTNSDALGRFEIAYSPDDSLRVAFMGYKKFPMAVDKSSSNLHIELEPKVISLNGVVVHGDRDFKKDSIANRLEYARQFNYTGPRVIDAFVSDPNKGYGELISVNPLVLIQALTKKSSPEYKFKQSLIKDEHQQYVDEHFNHGIVSRITGMQGDTLAQFLVQYRPTYEFTLKSTDYDMQVYIRACFEKFRNGGYKIDGMLSKEN